MFVAASAHILVASRPDVSSDISTAKSYPAILHFSLNIPMLSKTAQSRIALATELSTLAKLGLAEMAKATPIDTDFSAVLNIQIPMFWFLPNLTAKRQLVTMPHVDCLDAPRRLQGRAHGEMARPDPADMSNNPKFG
jgi:hypothetical protein